MDQPKPPPPPALPAPALLGLIVAAGWLSLRPYWQSDDFIALHHAAATARAFGDLFGPQYDLHGVALFYRPLITLSFWFETTLFGPQPELLHLSNTLAHALSACLVGMLAARFLGAMRGWMAGLVWGLAPTHAGSVFWTVGRVDAHTTVWMLLACVLSLRRFEGRGRSLLLAQLAFVAALLSKESAAIVPGVVTVLAFAAAPEGRRVRRALSTWPLYATLGLFVLWRRAVLGTWVGGYSAAEFEPLAGLQGLGAATLTLVNPLRMVATSVDGLEPWMIWSGYVPAAITVAYLAWRRRFAVLAVATLCFAGAVVPTMPLWSAADSALQIRVFYVPFVAIACLIAAGGVVPSILLLAVFALPNVAIHRDYYAQFETNRAMHGALLREAPELGDGPLFVAGLPWSNPDGTALAFKEGVDRLLRPPFVDAPGRAVLALRPLDPRPDAFRLPYGESTGLPFTAANTVRLADGGRILALLPPNRLAPLELTLEAPTTIATDDLLALYERRREAWIRVDGAVAPQYRVSLFTAGGYLTTLVANRAPAGADHGRIDIVDVLVARYVSVDRPDQCHVAFALEVPTGLDLEPSFPVLVEAGALDAATGTFTATHANHEVLRLGLERSFAKFIATR